MQTYIAFIRGINVGRTRSVPMKALAADLEAAGLDGVRTYIQSGNLVFRSGTADAAELAGCIGGVIEASRGFRPRVLVLSQQKLQQAVEANPFPAGEDDPKSLHLFFLDAKPKDPDLGRLDAARAGREDYRLVGTVFYLYAPDGIARSKLAGQVDKALGVSVTARNWRTANRVLEMALDAADG
jgi:uncharacterized protein (DUF1697 family)